MSSKNNRKSTQKSEENYRKSTGKFNKNDSRNNYNESIEKNINEFNSNIRIDSVNQIVKTENLTLNTSIESNNKSINIDSLTQSITVNNTNVKNADGLTKSVNTDSLIQSQEVDNKSINTDIITQDVSIDSINQNESSYNSIDNFINIINSDDINQNNYNFSTAYESEVYIDNNAYSKDDDEKYKRKKMITSAIIVMVICIGLSYFFISRRAIVDKFEMSLYNNDYDKALKLYEDVPKNRKTTADNFIVKKIQNIFDRYSSGEITSDDAVDELKELDNIKSGVRQTIAKSFDQFDRIIKSEECFELADDYYEKKDYKNAIINYYSVIDADYNYANAQKMLKDSIEEYKKIEFPKAEEYIQKNDFDTAIEMMKESHNLIQSDSEIKDKYKEYIGLKLNVHIQDILVAADEYAEKNDYIGVIKVMYDAIEEYGQDNRLVEKYDEYKKILFDTIQKNIEEKNYNRAIRMTDEYMEIVGNDEELNNIVKDYRQFADEGISISELNLKTTEGKMYISKDSESYNDCYGNNFDRIIELMGYKNLDDEGKIVIENTGFVKIKGVIGYSTYEYFQSGAGKLVIKADDKVIFTQKDIKKSMTDVEVEVDIPSCSEISILWSKEDNNKHAYGIIMGDFRLIAEDTQ